MGEGIAETSQLERKLDTGHDILRLSSHRMCAFSPLRDLVPSPTAQSLGTDAVADPYFGQQLAINRNASHPARFDARRRVRALARKKGSEP